MRLRKHGASRGQRLIPRLAVRLRTLPEPGLDCEALSSRGDPSLTVQGYPVSATTVGCVVVPPRGREREPTSPPSEEGVA